MKLEKGLIASRCLHDFHQSALVVVAATVAVVSVGAAIVGVVAAGTGATVTWNNQNIKRAPRAICTATLSSKTIVPDVNCLARTLKVGSCPGIDEKMGVLLRTIYTPVPCVYVQHRTIGGEPRTYRAAHHCLPEIAVPTMPTIQCTDSLGTSVSIF